MDIKDIRFYMECYEARSINKAAKSLFITPQGLGKALDRINTLFLACLLVSEGVKAPSDRWHKVPLRS